MYRCRVFVVIACVAMLLISFPSFAADAASEAVLKEKGLAKSGNNYALPDETNALALRKTLVQTKAQADKEMRLRQAAEARIAAKATVIRDGTREWEQLEARLASVKDVKIHNTMVTRMNGIVTRVKEASLAKKDMEEDARKLSSEKQMKFVDDLLEAAAKFDAVNEKYDAIAKDADVKSAVTKMNATLVSNKVTVGPSPEFATASAEIKKWQSAIDSQAIPMRQDHGVNAVDVLLAGSEQVMMLVDTGATYVTLPYELAVKLKMEPKEQDQTIRMKLADGNVIDGKLMVLKAVRVGRFTVNDVSCVVLQKNLAAAPMILGDSFLEHFIVKMNQKSGELFLTELKDEKAAGSKTTSSDDKPAPAKPAGSVR